MYHWGWGGVQGRGGSYSVLYIFTCLVLFVFTVNKLVNVKIYFYSYPMICKYILCFSLLVHVCISVSWPTIVS